MGRVAGQPALALDGLADALEQLILRLQQGAQFAGQRMDLQGLQGVGIATHQRIAHAIERRQALADTQPQQAQATEQRQPTGTEAAKRIDILSASRSIWRSAVVMRTSPRARVKLRQGAPSII